MITHDEKCYYYQILSGAWETPTYYQMLHLEPPKGSSTSSDILWSIIVGVNGRCWPMSPSGCEGRGVSQGPCQAIS